MVVENSSKAGLIAFGTDYPKTHDVSFIFKQISKEKYSNMVFHSWLMSWLAIFLSLKGLAD